VQIRYKPTQWSPAVQADAYFFDIDGTILVTRDLVHWNALHQAMLEVYGVDTTIEGIPYHGKTDVGILRAAMERCGVESREFDQGLPSAREIICREVSVHASEIRAEVCPSIPALLRELHGLGKLLGVASGNFETVGWHKVEAAGVRQFFSFGCFGDHSESRSEIFGQAVIKAKGLLGSGARVCFIGDTPEDIKAARNVQAQIIAVGTGIYGTNQMVVLGPDACCQSCTELLGILR
jgi:phosphoglycolate phosphatase-like HAD superfamily hydrolase